MRDRFIVLSLKLLAFSLKHLALSYKHPTGERRLGLARVCGLALPKIEWYKNYPFLTSFYHPSGELACLKTAQLPGQGKNLKNYNKKRKLNTTSFSDAR